VSEAELERLHAPIGLRIGSRSPEEIALSVMAEIVAARNGVLA
jgi:xanthine dehydrogenase accessory factor